MDVERLLPASATELPTAKYVFVTLLVLILALAAGQWYLLAGRTELYLGVPLWLWLQLVVIAAMLGLAWVAVTVWTAANDMYGAGTRAVETGRESDTEETEW